jgi:acetyltransferase-like isoleucine patch superfamily enzyme
MNIGSNCVISWKSHLDKSINPKGIHIGDNTWILSGAMVLSHDYCRGLKIDTHIGNNCVIGIRAIILPGVIIGDHVLIGAGSVVTKDIPSNSIAVGVPARVVKKNIVISDKGQLI